MIKCFYLRCLLPILSVVTTLCLTFSPALATPFAQTDNHKAGNASANQHLEEGKKLLQAEQFPTALRELTTAQQFYNQANDLAGEAESLFWIGMLYRSTNKRDDALTSFQDALALTDQNRAARMAIPINATVPITQSGCITGSSESSKLESDLTANIANTQYEIASDAINED